MVSLIGYGLLGLGALWMLVIALNNYVIPVVKKFWPNAVPASVESTVDKIDDYADMVAAIGACFTITAIAKKRGDADLENKVSEVRVLVAKLSS